MVDCWATMADDQAARPARLDDTLRARGLRRGACNYDFGLLDTDAGRAPFAVAVPDSTKESIARIAEPRPDFTLLSGPAKRARKRKYRARHQGAVLHGRGLVQGRLNTCPLGQQTDLLTRLITVPDPRPGTAPGPRHDPRPDSDAPLERV